MTALIAAHFVVAMLAPWLGRLLGHRQFWLAAVVPAAAVVWLIAQAPTVLGGGVVTEVVPWIPGLGIDLDIRIGAWQWLLAMVVSLVGAAVLFYCRSYFAEAPSQARVAGLLTAFAGAMLGLVTSDNLLSLYVYWELTTVFSYLLVGHNPLRSANRGAALTALIVTTFGGLAMLIGLIGLSVITHTTHISQMLASSVFTDPNFVTTPAAIAAALLVLLGALTKSAQVPFHFWLPGAMAAPTPVSAYLHAAAMVKAGIYLVGLVAPVAALVPGFRAVLLVLGSVTMVMGGWQALRQYDIKLLMAFGTVSQLGFMMTLCGVGTQSAALAGAGVVAAHALFKATLFMVVGIVDHSTGTRDLRELAGVGRRMPVVATVAAIAGASMAGFPPLAGFVAKEGAFESLLAIAGGDADGTGLPAGPGYLVVAAIAFGSILTVAYTLRFWWGAFAGKSPAMARTTVHPVGAGFAFAPFVLALLSVVGGFVGHGFTEAMSSWTSTFGGHEPHGLALWHGFTPALLISVGCWVVGLTLFALRDRVASGQQTFPDVYSAQEVYRAGMLATDRLAVLVTARMQRGSLPAYLGAILVVVVLLPGTITLLSPDWGTGLRWFDSIGQLAVAIVVIGAAFLAATANGRMKAVMLVGVTGYGVSLLFLLHGAPDLALTQMLVETVSLVTLVLVLRKLPKYFSDAPLRSSRWWRMALAVLVGATVSGAAYLSTVARVAEPVGARLHEYAYSFGYGKNIVNVTLVDTRAWDTFGEISVLVVAGTGVASLIYLRARSAEAKVVSPTEETVPEVRSGLVPAGRRLWLRGGVSLNPAARSMVLEMVTRLLFPVMILISLYLLIAGHDSPGGGFAGGLVAGLAIMIRYLAGGRDELDEAAPVDPGTVMGAGLALAGLSAVVPVAFGGRILQSYVIDGHIPYLSSIATPWGELPLLGEIHLVSSVFFDIGVYLVVVGLMLDLARSLGSQIDVHAETDLAPRLGSHGQRSGTTTHARLSRTRRFTPPDEDEW